MTPNVYLYMKTCPEHRTAEGHYRKELRAEEDLVVEGIVFKPPRSALLSLLKVLSEDQTLQVEKRGGFSVLVDGKELISGPLCGITPGATAPNPPIIQNGSLVVLEAILPYDLDECFLALACCSRG